MIKKVILKKDSVLNPAGSEFIVLIDVAGNYTDFFYCGGSGTPNHENYKLDFILSKPDWFEVIDEPETLDDVIRNIIIPSSAVSDGSFSVDIKNVLITRIQEFLDENYTIKEIK